MEHEGRGTLASYFLVGLAGAVIGALLVVGITPQILVHRASLLLPLAAEPSAQVIPSVQPSESVPTPLSPTDDPWQAVVAVAEKVSPAVVGIITKQGGLYDFFGREYEREASGTGLIITPDGYIVTNNHVVQNAKSVAVHLADGHRLEAEVVGTDPRTDLAVIKIEGSGLPIGVLGDSDLVKTGELAVAIGNPLGETFSRTVTQGVVSGLNRVIDISEEASMRLIQTDAVINPGNSGGPLLNVRGEVIGLTSVKLVTESVESMGFAIPSNMVRRLAGELMETGYVKRALMGVGLQDAERVAQQYGLKATRGAYVAQVTGGAADKAGVKVGDVIVSFDGTPVDSMSTLRAILAEKSPGDTVNLEIVRGSETIVIEVALEEAPR